MAVKLFQIKREEFYCCATLTIKFYGWVLSVVELMWSYYARETNHSIYHTKPIPWPKIIILLFVQITSHISFTRRNKKIWISKAAVPVFIEGFYLGEHIKIIGSNPILSFKEKSRSNGSFRPHLTSQRNLVNPERGQLVLLSPLAQ